MTAHVAFQDYSGALYLFNVSLRQTSSYGTNNCGLGLDASRSNSIYGSSNTVQPPAVKIRVKTRYK